MIYSWEELVDSLEVNSKAEDLVYAVELIVDAFLSDTIHLSYMDQEMAKVSITHLCHQNVIPIAYARLLMTQTALPRASRNMPMLDHIKSVVSTLVQEERPDLKQSPVTYPLQKRLDFEAQYNWRYNANAYVPDSVMVH